MPSLPKPKARSWEPKRQVVKQAYKPHAERTSLYDSPLWRRVRAAHLAREPLCRECLKHNRATTATVCDHIRAVRDGADFWDASNYQSLCSPCHHRKSAREGHQRKQQNKS